jgi:hypothetical protein
MTRLLLPHRQVFETVSRKVTAWMLALTVLSSVGIENWGLNVPKAEAATGINRTINYQGKVALTAGTAVSNGSYNMRFKIFNAATNGTQLWAETWNSGSSQVTMTGGLFSVALGTYVSMTGSVDFNSDSLYLQVEFDPSNAGTYPEVFSPRRRFASVPYAFNAEKVGGIGPNQFLRSDQASTASGKLTIKNAGVGLNITGIGSGKILSAQDSLTSSGKLVIKGATTLQNYVSCGVITTDASGNLGCSTALSTSTGSLRNSFDARYVNTSGDTMTGGLLIQNGGTPGTIKAGHLLEFKGAASGASLTIMSNLASSGTLVVNNGVTFKSLTSCTALQTASNGALSCNNAVYLASSTGSLKTFFDANYFRTSTGALQSRFDNRYVNTSGDTMTGGLLIQSGNPAGTIDAGLLLEIAGTASGRIIHAQDQLQSSGSLIVQTTGLFKGNLTTRGTISGAVISIGGLAPTNVGLNVFGAARIGGRYSDPAAPLPGAGKELLIYPTLGASSTGGIVLQHDAIDTVFFRSNGTSRMTTIGANNGVSLAINNSNGRVGIGTTIPKTKLEVAGSMSGASLAISNLSSCAVVVTSSNGTLSCGSFPSGGTSTGALQTAFDSRYVNVSGDTMTGGLLIQNGNPAGTIKAGFLLEVKGAMSGSSLTVASNLASSGTLVVKGGVTFKGLTSCTNLQTASNGALSCNNAVYLASSTGSLKTFFDANYFRTSTGAMQVAFDRRYVNVSGDTMTGALIIRPPTSASTDLFTVQDSAGIARAWFNVNNQTSQLTVNNIYSTGYVGIGMAPDSAVANTVMTTDSATRKALVIRGIAGQTANLQEWQNNGGTILGYVSSSGSGSFQALAIGTAFETGLKFEVAGTASGRSLFAQDSLISSGTLTVRNTVTFKNLSSCAVVVTSSTGVLSCGAAPVGSTSTGSLQTAFDKRYVNVSGDTMTGGLLIQNGGTAGTIKAGFLLEVKGAMSGSSLTVASNLASSGTLVVNNGVTFKGLTSCTALQTSSNGALSCNNAVYLASSTGSLKTFFDSLYFRTSTGALRNSFDARYVKKSGDTMTGALVINGSANTVQLYLHAAANTTRDILSISGSSLTTGGLATFYSNASAIGPRTLVRIWNDNASATGATAFAVRQDSSATGAFVDQRGEGVALDIVSYAKRDAGIRINMASGSTAQNPHLLFGYKGTFDTALFRSTANARSLTVSGNLLPVANNYYTLGSDTLRWKDLYLGGNSLHVGTSGNEGTISYLLLSSKLAFAVNGSTQLNITSSAVQLPNQLSCAALVTDISGNISCGSAFSTSTGSLRDSFDNRFVKKAGDTMTGGLMIVNGGHTLTAIDAGLLLEVAGTASGRVLKAMDTLASSGILSVRGKTYLQNTVFMRNLVSCTALQTTSSGALQCGTATVGSTFGTGSLTTAFDRRYVNVSGDTMTGGLLIQSGGTPGTIEAGLLLEIAGTMSGRIIHAQDTLSSSGTIVLESASNAGAVSMRTGTGDPNGSVAGTKASLYFATDTAKIWKNNDGGTAWVEVISGTGSVHMAKMTRSALQTIPPATFTKINLDTEEFDVGNIASTATSRFTIVKTGKYLVTANWYCISPGGYNEAIIYKNGSPVANGVLSSSNDQTTQVTDTLALNAGDYIEMYGYTTSSCNTNTTAELLPRMSVVQLDGVAGVGSSGGGSLFTDAGALTYLTAETDNFAIGGSNVGAALYFDYSKRLLEVANISGAVLHAQDTLASSGTLVVRKAGSTVPTLYANGSTGHVGIGTASPQHGLHVLSTTSNEGMEIQQIGGTSDEGVLFFAKSRGTPGSQAIVQNGDGIGRLTFSGFDGATDAEIAQIAVAVDGTPGSGDMPGRIVFSTTPDGSITDVERMRLNNAGNLGIGTTNPGSRLAVSGAVIISRLGTLAGAVADPTVALEIIGTASGRVLRAQDALASSGVLSVTGKTYLQNTVFARNLVSCATLQTTSSGALQCGTPSSTSMTFGTGSLTNAFDRRYVNTSGDTMTGALRITWKGASSGSTLLNVNGTMSGRSLFISGTGSSPLLSTDLGSNSVGIGIAVASQLGANSKLHVAGGNLKLDSNSSLTWDGIFPTSIKGVSGTQGYIQFNAANGSESTRILASGNMVIGADTADTRLEIIGTASGRVLRAQDALASSGTLIVAGSVMFHNLVNCPSIVSDANGLLSCGSAGGGSVSTGALAVQFDRRYVNTSGDTMTGGLLIQNGGTPGTIKAGHLLEFKGAASGASLTIMSNLASSGTLVVNNGVTFKGLPSCTALQTASNGALSCNNAVYLASSTGSLKTFFDANYFRTSTGALQSRFDNRYVNTSGDTMTGGLLIQSGGTPGTIKAGHLLEIKGAMSGASLTIMSNLASSGTLVVKNSVTFKSLTSCAVVVTSSTGVLSCGSFPSGGTSTGALQTAFDNRYVKKAGDTMTGGLLIQNGNPAGTIKAGFLLEVKGAMSGSSLTVASNLASSGTLVVKNGVTFKGLTSCTNLQTASNGALSCNNAVYLASSTGSLKTFFDSLYFRSSTGSLKTYFDGLYTRTSTGALQIAFDRRYVNASGDTMTGTLIIQNGSVHTPTNAALLSVRGTMSGVNILAQGALRSSGSLAVEGNAGIVGSLAVGAKTAGANKFLVSGGDVNFSSNDLVFSLTNTATTRSWSLKNGNSPSGTLLFREGNVSHVAFTQNGLVGIGTDTPGSMLSVSGAVLINPNGTIGSTAADAGLALEITGTASGRVLRAQDALASSGTLVVTGTVNFKNLVNCDTIDTDANGRLVCGTDAAGGGGLAISDGDVRYVNASGDTMTGGLLIQNGTVHGALPAIDAGLLLEVAGTASGRVLKAMDTLASSGVLSVRGATFLQSTIFARNLISCATLQTTSSGALQCGAAGSTGMTFGTGSLTQAFDKRYVNTSGDTMTGGLLIQNGGTTGTIKAGFLLEVKGAMSGSSLTVASNLASSGTLVVNNGVTFKGLPSCTNLQTSSNGALSCNNAVYLASSTGSLKTFFDANYFRTSTGALKTYFDTLYTRTSTGALQVAFDRRYVNTSGDTMTGGLLIQNGGTAGTIKAGHLLEIKGAMSGASLTIMSGLASSGTLVVQNGVTFKGLVSCANLQTSSNGALSCNNAVYLASSTGSLKTFFDANYFRTSTGALRSSFDARYVNTSGDTMTGGLLIQSGGTPGTIDAGLLLEIAGTASGRVIRAQDTLASSGTLVVRGMKSTPSLSVSTVTGRVGIGTAAPATTLEVSSGTYATGVSQLRITNKTPFSAASRTEAGLEFYAADAGYVVPDKAGRIYATYDGGNYIDARLTLQSVQVGAVYVDTMTLKNAMVGIGTTNPESALEVIGTASGRVLRAQDTLASSGVLVIRGATFLQSTVYARNLVSCASLQTTSSGALQCGTGGSTSMTFGTGSLTNGFDKRYVNASGDTMTGGLLIQNGGTAGTIKAGFLLEVKGAMSGSSLTVASNLASSGTLVVNNGVTFKGLPSCTNLQTSSNGALSCNNAVYLASSTGSLKTLFDANYFRSSTGSLKTFFDANYFRTSTGALRSSFDARYVNTSGDTMTGGLLIKSGNAGAASIKAGLLLEIGGTASGADLFAQKSLRSSGTLVVDGASYHKGTIYARNLVSCTSIQTTSSGALQCGTGGSSTMTFGTGSLTQAFDKRYVNTSGDTMTGGLLIQNGGTPGTIAAGHLLEIKGAMSGASLTVMSNLASSGTLVVKGGVTFKSLTSCTNLQTSSNGALSCNNAVYLASSTGSLKTFFDANYFRTSTGALRSSFDARYVNTSGDTMTGGLLIQSGGTPGTIDAGLLLEIAGTASGRTLRAMDTLASSGVLLVKASTKAYSALYASGLTGRVGIGGITAPGSALALSGAMILSNNGNLTTVGADAGIALEVVGTMSGRLIHAQNRLDSSGTLVVRASTKAYAALVVDGLSARVGIGGINAPGSALALSGAMIISGDGNLTTVGADVGVALEIVGTASGRTLRAMDTLASSGMLIVRNARSRFGTGAMIYSSGGTVLALDSYRGPTQIKAKPHLLFGYRGTFDTNLYRSTGAALRTDGRFEIYSGTGRTALTIVSGAVSSASTNLVELYSQASTGFGTSYNNKVFRIDAAGSVYSDNAYNSSGADYAEWFYTSDKDLKPGEVVCIDLTRPNAVRKCDRSGDENVMGIVSSKPSFVGNTLTGAEGLPVPGTVLVGLIGQIVSNAVVESGASIRIGDALTPASLPGYVRKAGPGEANVGVALEPLASGKGRVQVLIARRNGSMSAQAVDDRVLQTVKDLKIEDELKIALQHTIDDLTNTGVFRQSVATEVNRQIDTLNVQTRIAELESQIAQLKTTTVTDVLLARIAELEKDVTSLRSSPATGVTASGSAATGKDLSVKTLQTEDTLTVGKDARIAGDLYLDGILHAQDFNISGIMKVDGSLDVGTSLHAAALSIDSGATIGGTLTLKGNLDIAQGGQVTFATGSVLSVDSLIVRSGLQVLGPVTISGLAQFLGDVEIHGTLTVSSRQAGEFVLPKTGTSVTISFNPPYASKPEVVVTPHGRVGSEWWVDFSSETGFILRVASPAPADVSFSWIALGVTSGTGATAMAHTSDGLIAFPVDVKGYPVSSQSVWNACIRNHTILDDSGQPLSCARYHDGHVWHHPDFNMDITFDSSHESPILILPEGYEAQTVDYNDITVPQGVLDNTPPAEDASSSSVSSEAVSSESSSVSSEAQSSSSEASVSSEASTSSAEAVSSEAPVTEPAPADVPAAPDAPAEQAPAGNPETPAAQ